MNESLDFALVETRLGIEVPSLRYVGGAANYAAAVDTPPPQLPVAYIVPAADQAGENKYSSGVVGHDVVELFDVILALQNVADAAGKASYGELRTLRLDVLEGLLGWAPDGTHYGVVEFARGRLLGFNDQVLWWADTFRTHRYVRSV